MSPIAWFGRVFKWLEWQEETQSWGLFTKALHPQCFEQSVAASSDSLEHVMIQNKSVGGRGC